MPNVNAPSRQNLASKYKIHGSYETQGGIEIILGYRSSHIAQGKDSKDTHGNDFLDNFKLLQAKCFRSNTIGRNLKAVLEKRYAPTQKNGQIEWSCFEIFEVTVPGITHENIGNDEESNSSKHAPMLELISKPSNKSS
jgi:hypothetical protein